MHIKNDKNAKVSISDITGTLIKSYTVSIINTSITVDLSNLLDGVYVLQVKSDQQNIKTKVVKK